MSRTESKTKFYRVYGKHKNDKTFRAMDMSNGTFTSNLIYASFFYEHEYEGLQREVDYMNEHNPDYTFEIREVRE